MVRFSAPLLSPACSVRNRCSQGELETLRIRERSAGIKKSLRTLDSALGPNNCQRKRFRLRLPFFWMTRTLCKAPQPFSVRGNTFPETEHHLHCKAAAAHLISPTNSQALNAPATNARSHDRNDLQASIQWINRKSLPPSLQEFRRYLVRAPNVKKLHRPRDPSHANLLSSTKVQKIEIQLIDIAVNQGKVI